MRARAAALLFVPAAAAAAAQPDFAALVRNQAPAVVSIAAAYSIPPVVPDVPHDEVFAEFLERVARAGSGEAVALLVARGGGHAFVPLRIPDQMPKAFTTPK